LLNCTVLCVGRLKEEYLRAACLEYEKRLGGFVKLQIVEVEEERLPASPSPAEIRQGLEAEGRRLLAKAPAGAAGIAMCIEGTLLSSEKLAETIGKWMGGVRRPVYRRLPRPVGRGEEGGPPAPVHVADDVSAPARPGYGARTALPGYADPGGRQIP